MTLLDRLAAPAVFPVDASALDVFTDQGPAAFYQTLRDMIRNAKRRISLASLYWGTEDKEQTLLADLRYALEHNPDLKVTMVLDFFRAQRKTPNGNSITFLAELLRDYPARVEFFLHKMPQFDGPASWLPSPLDEIVAVCHFKALLVDDAAILTGANLSDEYFHCRQARYILVRDRPFVEIIQSVVAITAEHSWQIRCDRHGNASYQDSQRRSRGIDQALERCVTHTRQPTNGRHDTFLVPLFQHPALRLYQERQLLQKMFTWCDGELVVTTPYPNFPADYVEALVARLRAGCGQRTLIIGPSDQSHSFTTGRGLKALVPGMYLHRERQFLQQLDRAAKNGSSGTTSFRHYHRPGWVFHSKGVWFDTEDESATVIGSSSFGERSVSRDFDMSCLLVTKNDALRQNLQQEVHTMMSYARDNETISHRASLASQLLVPLVSKFL